VKTADQPKHDNTYAERVQHWGGVACVAGDLMAMREMMDHKENDDYFEDRAKKNEKKNDSNSNSNDTRKAWSVSLNPVEIRIGTSNVVRRPTSRTFRHHILQHEWRKTKNMRHTTGCSLTGSASSTLILLSVGEKGRGEH
jgi:hypothetical protein